MKRRLFSLALSMLSPALTGQTLTLTLTPSQDSDVYAFFDGPSFSTFDLNVGASGAAQTHSHHALLQFNLSSLNLTAAEVASARLRLFVLEPNSTNGGTLRGGEVAVHRQGASWQVAGLRWRNLQPQEQVGQLTVRATDLFQWVELDLTTLVRQWISGSQPNHGVLLRPRSETDLPWTNLLFASMEIADFAPQLVITRHSAPPPPVTNPPASPVPASPPPQLNISHEGGNVVLEWPATATEWSLEQANDPNGPWSAGPTGSATGSGTLRVIQASSPSGRAFFRLKRNSR